MKKMQGSKGYSLGEALIVVAIIIVLLAIAIPSIFTIKKNVRQTELDTKAETIYQAVQNQLVKMRTGGNTDIYQFKGTTVINESGYVGSQVPGSNYVYQFAGHGGIPFTETSTTNLRMGDICYITSDELGITEDLSAAVDSVMMEGVVDEELRSGHWVIEYNPASGSVYGVFYSETEVNCAEGYKSNIVQYDEVLRVSKENRRAAGATVGYYGGETIAKINNTKSLRPTLTVTNAEKLTASISCTVPVNFGTSRPVFKVQVEDTEGNTYIKYYTVYDVEPGFIDKINAEITSTENSTHVDVEDLDLYTVVRTGRLYTLDLTLDDLTSESTRFYNTYGEGGNHNEKLASGTPLKITVTAMCPGNYTVTQNRTATAYTNSLFADDNAQTSSGALNTAFGSEDNPAVVTYGRHLQNMDQTSGVISSVRYFVQGRDINFNDIAAAHDTEDWYETYSARFFNGITSDGNANFKPIHNDNILLFNGQRVVSETKADGTTENVTYTYRIGGLHVEATTNAGLFELLGDGQKLSYVMLTGAMVRGTNNYAAGTLVGLINGSATLEHCQSYLINTDITGKTNRDIWVYNATAVGGLIGNINSGNVLIDSCSASTVVGAYTFNTSTIVASDMTSDYAGGLIGIMQGGSLTLRNSYADNYLAGKYAGGLIGTVSEGTVINADHCYAAGFITFSAQGSGLVVGSANFSNSYTNMFRQYLPTYGVDELPYYAVANGGTMNNVYYESATSPASIAPLTGTIMISSLEEDTNRGSMEVMPYLSKLLNGGVTSGAFTMNNAGSAAYNLMSQTLSSYTYPGLAGVTHYGDWKAEFQPGALVYYEVYSDPTAQGGVSYGFFGANVDSSLRDDLPIIGDGYGFVYRRPGTAETDNEGTTTSGSLPELLRVYVGTEEVTNSTTSAYYPDGYKINGNNNYYETSDGYFIYPLSKELVNAAAVQGQYYTQIKVVNPSLDKADYYYFNPLFAQTVTTEDNPTLTKDSTINIRSARHLYNMSVYYDTLASVTETATYTQWRNIPYDSYIWSGFTLRTDDTSFQAPISGNETADGGYTSFTSTYNGRGFWITNVSFVSEDGLYTGFFGVNEGTIENVVLRAEYTEDADDNCYVARTGDVGINQTLYQGVLVGRNEAGGSIRNSAVAGYYLAGSDGTIHAYENSYVYAGGLVGANAGTIENCSADIPEVRLSSTFANVNIGGFVGINSNTIRDSYALGHIEVIEAKGGSVTIAGFAGRNGGVIRDSYCVTALTAGGETTKAYGFAPVGGGAYNCTFLDGGTYSYVDHMYAYNNNVGSGTAILYGNLKITADSFDHAVYSYNFNNTETSSSSYPFRAVVRNMKGELVHYGDWLDDENLGSVGLFYWEHEEGGMNDGYHLTFLGSDGTTKVGGSTLCTSHDDGGIITEYGYGYYEKNLGATSVEIVDALLNGGTRFSIGTANNYEAALDNANLNKAASLALHEQIFYTTSEGTQAPYYFFAFTTRTSEDATAASRANGADNGNYLVMNKTNDNDATNATIKLTYTSATTGSQTRTVYTYTFCPFFANAMQTTNGATVRSSDGTYTYYADNVGKYTNGTCRNPYEIRSIMQLQFINWKTGGSGTGDTYRYSYKDTVNAGTPSLYFPYGSSSTSDNDPKYLLQFSQTHDISNNIVIDANGNPTSARFYPLGRAAKSFKMRYNGNSYQVRNLRIEETSSSYVGLFGQIGNTAYIENMILTADPGMGLISSSWNSDNDREAAVGAFAGLVWVNTGSSPIKLMNCSASGYTIEYRGTYTDTNRCVTIGGLVGSLYSGTIKNCFAVNSVEMNGTISSGSNRGSRQHLGGLVGSAGAVQDWANHQNDPGYVINCYSGGSIKTNNYNDIYSGGLIGNTRAYPQSKNNSPYEEGYSINCYTYCDSLALYTEVGHYENRTREVEKWIPAGNQQVWVEGHYESVYVNGYWNGWTYVWGHYEDRWVDGKWDWKYVEGHYETVTETYQEWISDGVVYDSKRNPLCGNSVNNETNCYYLKVEAGDINAAALSYEEMSNGTLLTKLNGMTGTGGVAAGVNQFHNVTTTEGSSNVNISGKYSYPVSSYLEGKDYPFPAIAQQKDLTFSTVSKPVYVFVHYGDWPVADAYWSEGRSSLDIFADMQDSGYAVKTFYINVNGREDLGTLSVSNFEINSDIAKVVSVGTAQNGLIPVQIQAVNTGTTVVKMKSGRQSISFALEVTANLRLTSSQEIITLKNDDSLDVTFTALDEKSLAKDFSLNSNGSWTVISENDILVKATDTAVGNVKTVTREGLGETILEVKYDYTYHPDENTTKVFTTSIYLDVIQPDTVGLSDNNSYSVAFMGSTAEGSIQGYRNDKPGNTDGDYYLYIDSKTIGLANLTIEGIYVNDVEATWDSTKAAYFAKDPNTGDDSLVGYYLNLNDNITSDRLYEYRAGTIYHVTEGDATRPVSNVKLKFLVKDASNNLYTLEIQLPSVVNRKQITVTYYDTAETGEGVVVNKLEIQMLSGEYTVLSPEEVKTEAGKKNITFRIPDNKAFNGWSVGNDATALSVATGFKYDNLTESITLIPNWVNQYTVTYNLNNASTTFAWVDGFVPKVLYKEGEAITLPAKDDINTATNSFWSFIGWYDVSDENKTLVTTVEGIHTDTTFQALWYRNVKITLKDASMAETEGYTGYSTWLWDDVSTAVNSYAQIYQEPNVANFPSHEGFTLLGWYVMNEGGTIGAKVLDTEGNFVLNVPGYTDEDSLNVPDDVKQFELYALWGKDSSKKTVYVATDTLVENGEYLITDSNQTGTHHALNSANTANDVIIASKTGMYNMDGIVSTYVALASGNEDKLWLGQTIVDGDNTYTGVIRNVSQQSLGYLGVATTGLSINAVLDPTTASGWTYSTTDHHLLLKGSYLGSLLSTPTEAGQTPTSKGVFAVSTDIAEATTQITTSYLYQKKDVYETVTFVPYHEVKFHAYDMSADPEMTVEIKENATSMADKLSGSYDVSGYSGMLLGWYEIKDGAIEKNICAFNADGAFADGYRQSGDLEVIAKWQIDLYVNGAKNTVTFYGSVTDLSTLENYPTVPTTFEGWYALIGGELKPVTDADGKVLDGYRLSDYKALYEKSVVNLHFGKVTDTDSDKALIILEASSTTLAGLDNYPSSTTLGTNFAGWYAYENDKYVPITDNSGAVLEGQSLLGHADLYAGWTLILHTSSSASGDSVVVFRDSNDVTKLLGYPASGYANTIVEWIDNSDNIVAAGNGAVVDGTHLATYTDLYATWNVSLYTTSTTTVAGTVKVSSKTTSITYPVQNGQTVPSGFDGWYKDFEDLDSKVTNVTAALWENTSLYAGYKITLHPYVGKQQEITYLAGTTTLTLSTNISSIVNNKNQFKGWVDASKNSVDITNNANIINYTDLYGKWTINFYTERTVYQEVTLYGDSNAVGYVPTRTGTTFQGWYVGTGASRNAVTDTSGRITNAEELFKHENVYARWSGYLRTASVTSGTQYVIVVGTNALSANTSNKNPTSKTVTLSNDNSSITSEVSNDLLWTVNGDSSSFTLANGNNYLRCRNGNNTGLRSNTTDSFRNWSYSSNRLYNTSKGQYLMYNSGFTTTESSWNASTVWMYAYTTHYADEIN